jgi:hypothetical protein
MNKNIKKGAIFYQGIWAYKIVRIIKEDDILVLQEISQINHNKKISSEFNFFISSLERAKNLIFINEDKQLEFEF